MALAFAPVGISGLTIKFVFVNAADGEALIVTGASAGEFEVFENDNLATYYVDTTELEGTGVYFATIPDVDTYPVDLVGLAFNSVSGALVAGVESNWKSDGTQITQRSLDTLITAVASLATLIKAKTDLIPATPAAVGSAMTLEDGAITSGKFTIGSITAHTTPSGFLERLYLMTINLFNRRRKANGVETLYDADAETALFTKTMESNENGSEQDYGAFT